MSGFPWWPYGELTAEQLEDIERSLGYPLGEMAEPVKRAAFDLEEQTDEDFAAFLAEVEANENERIDRELEKAAETEEQIAELKESVE